MESLAYAKCNEAKATIAAGDYRTALRLCDQVIRLACKEKDHAILADAMVLKGISHRRLAQVSC